MRAAAVMRLSVLMVFLYAAATGQAGGSAASEGGEPKVEQCRAGMQVIITEYNNARYAVQRAQWGGDRAHILDGVRAAQAALEKMEEPLKACNAAMQETQRPKEDGKP